MNTANGSPMKMDKDKLPGLYFYIKCLGDNMAVGFDTDGKPITGGNLMVQLAVGLWLLCAEISEQSGVEPVSVWKDLKSIIDESQDILNKTEITGD